MWLDISIPTDPVIMWGDGDERRMRLVEIIDISAGRSALCCSARADAGQCITFRAEGRSLVVELPCAEAAEFAFKKVNLLLRAYQVTQLEGLQGESVTVRVVGIVDGGEAARVRAALRARRETAP